jgi:hypothetical protein
MIEEMFEKQELKRREQEQLCAEELNDSAQKRKRDFVRNKPTIRSMMGSEQIKQFEDASDADKYLAAAAASATSRSANTASVHADVHDEIGDLFDFACVKSAHHNNNKFMDDDENSNDLSLEDILIKSVEPKGKARRRSSDDDSDDSDDLDRIFSAAPSASSSNSAAGGARKTKSNERVVETRTLRSRTITNRK